MEGGRDVVSDWLNPHTLWDDVSLNATCLINSKKTTTSIKIFPVLKWYSLINCNWWLSLDIDSMFAPVNTLHYFNCVEC